MAIDQIDTLRKVFMGEGEGEDTLRRRVKVVFVVEDT